MKRQTSPLAGTIYTAPKEQTECGTCSRNPSKMNSAISECSHVDCQFRGKSWSDRPTPAKYFKGPWPKNVDADPLPLDAKKCG